MEPGLELTYIWLWYRLLGKSPMRNLHMELKGGKGLPTPSFFNTWLPIPLFIIFHLAIVLVGKARTSCTEKDKFSPCVAQMYEFWYGVQTKLLSLKSQKPVCFLIPPISSSLLRSAHSSPFIFKETWFLLGGLNVTSRVLATTAPQAVFPPLICVLSFPVTMPGISINSGLSQTPAPLFPVLFISHSCFSQHSPFPLFFSLSHWNSLSICPHTIPSFLSSVLLVPNSVCVPPCLLVSPF